MSQVRTVESCAFDKSVWESGETCREQTVSVWPLMVYITSFFLRSQTLISLSNPPEYSSFPASESATAVIGPSVSTWSVASFCRGSQIFKGISVGEEDIWVRSYSNCAVIAPTYQHFYSTLTYLQRIDDFVVSRVPSYSLSCLCIPARNRGVGRRGE